MDSTQEQYQRLLTERYIELLPNCSRLCRACYSASETRFKECQSCGEPFEMHGLQDHCQLALGNLPENYRSRTPRLAPKLPVISMISARNARQLEVDRCSECEKAQFLGPSFNWSTSTIRIRCKSGLIKLCILHTFDVY